MKITPVNSTTFKLDNASYNKADVMVMSEATDKLSMFLKNGAFSLPVFRNEPYTKFTDSADAAFGSFAAASAYLAAAAAVDAEAAASTATASSNAATLSALNGIVTTESLTTAAAAVTTITITNTLVTTASLIQVTGLYASASAGSPHFRLGAVSNGSFTVIITNQHASAALNAAAKIHFSVK